MKGKALTYAAFGARGTGKTAWVKQLIGRLNPPRLLVWDFKHDPSLEGMGTAYRTLQAMIDAVREKRFSVRYLVDHASDIHAQFDLFCKVAWVVGDVLVFVDELPEVTKANKAPQAWRQLVNVGREYQHGGKVKRVAIIGAGQRPAECDKSFIANADVVHVGRLGNASDAQAMARSWGLHQREFMDLPDLHWREKRADTIEIQRGVLSFLQKKPTPKTTP